MVLFRNYFTKVTSQHADSECNSTHSIQCGSVDFKTIIMKSEHTVFAELKFKIFPSNKGIGRPIVKYSLLQHVLNVSF